jgi:alcohol dehydrogenase class IV
MAEITFPDMAELGRRLVIEEDVVKAVAEITTTDEDIQILISISRSLAKNSAIVQDIQDRLGSHKVSVASVLSEHTPYDAVFELANRITQSKATHVISIGGGSVIDGSKIALIVANLGLNSPEQLDALTYATEKGLQILDWPVRHIAIPTTLSGAEFTPLAGATSSVTGRKEGFLNPHLVPDHIILSASLSIHTPERLWLSSGVRSIDHAIETICAPGVDSEIADYCAEGLSLLYAGLKGCKASPALLDHRSESQRGVYFATAGLSRYRMGASHGLGYLLGVIGHVPHGLTSCVLLPAVLKYNLSDTMAQQTRIAGILEAKTAEEASPALQAFIGSLDLPNRLSQLEVSREALEEIKTAALTHPVVQANPKAITSREDVAQILNFAG